MATSVWKKLKKICSPDRSLLCCNYYHCIWGGFSCALRDRTWRQISSHICIRWVLPRVSCGLLDRLQCKPFCHISFTHAFSRPPSAFDQSSRVMHLVVHFQRLGTLESLVATAIRSTARSQCHHLHRKASILRSKWMAFFGVAATRTWTNGGRIVLVLQRNGGTPD